MGLYLQTSQVISYCYTFNYGINENKLVRTNTINKSNLNT
jgi:hypothetical protein